MARAVVEAVSEQLPSASALARDNVWLGQVPACQPALEPGVWTVVAVAAIWGMKRGRAVLTRWALPEEKQDPRWPPPPLANRRVEVASSRAVLAFWACLQDFVCVQRGPSGWMSGLPESHPFLRRMGVRLEVSVGQ